MWSLTRQHTGDDTCGAGQEKGQRWSSRSATGLQNTPANLPNKDAWACTGAGNTADKREDTDEGKSANEWPDPGERRRMYAWAHGASGRTKVEDASRRGAQG